MLKPIYLDNNATSAADPRVIEAVAACLRQNLGNPSSIHSFGREARALLTKSRDNAAEYIGVGSDEIIFTSGATEAANLILRGYFLRNSLGHIVTSGAEHACVFNTIKNLEKLGWSSTYLSVGTDGAVSPEAVAAALRPDTKMIAVMAANNETGVKSDIAGIAKVAQSAGIPFFVDGVALLGKEPIVVPPGISAMCFSGHKIHAPQGVGFCFVRKGFKIAPLFTGGGQQMGKRAGTENLPGIVGLSKAISLLREELPRAALKMERQRDHFERILKENLEGVFVNGTGPRVANTSNLCFSGVNGESLLTALDMDGVAASHGSACESGALEPSRVLLDMGLSRQRVDASLRFSLSRFTTDEEIEAAIEIIVRLVTKFKKN